MLVETLKKNGTRAWNLLSSERKWKKANVLTVLCSDKDEPLPELLCEGSRQWSHVVPQALCEDRDILLARLAHKDFPESYKYYWMPHHHFRLPPQFYGDKQVALATLKQYPKILEQEVLTEAVLDDRDVFLAFMLSEKVKEHHLFHLLSRFSERIHGNAALMVQAAKKHNPTVVLHNFAARLAGNYCFARKLVDALEEQDQSTPPDDRVLRRFNESIRSRKDVVLGLVHENGRCLQDADLSLKCDMEVVLAACKNNASALALADGSIQCQLGTNTEFLMEIFSHWHLGEKGDLKLHGRLPKTLKLDLNVVIAANKDGNLTFTDLPDELKHDPGFWLNMIKQDSSFWRGLPEAYESDPSFAHAIECFGNQALDAQVFERFPTLADDRDMWLTVISSYGHMDIEDVIGQHAPENIR